MRNRILTIFVTLLTIFHFYIPSLVLCAEAANVEMNVALHPFEDAEVERLMIFPRRQVPQIRRIYESDALWIAVNIREIALLPGDRLVLHDVRNTTRVEITRSNQSIAKAAWNQPLLWNHPFLMYGRSATIEYWPSIRTLMLPINRKHRDNPVVVIDSYTYIPRSLTETEESIVGATDEMKPAICYKRRNRTMYSHAKPVARLMIRRQQQDPPFQSRSSDSPTNSWTFCTGWLLGRENHLITNYHCFFTFMSSKGRYPLIQHTTFDNFSQSAFGSNSPDSSSSVFGSQLPLDIPNATVNFMAETRQCREKGTKGERVGVIGSSNVTIVAANEQLDYCLLQLQTDSDSDLADTYGFLTLRSTGPVDGEAIYIPQHANGAPKQIAATKDGHPAYLRMIATSSDLPMMGSTYDNFSVWYNADTKPGSSGSPVISQKDNTVVALHHAGGTDLSTSSGLKDETFNIGIRSDVIVADLQARGVAPPCAISYPSSNSTT